MGITDHSCTVNLDNPEGIRLKRCEKTAKDGKYETEPPDNIDSGTCCEFKIKDRGGFFGSRGSVKYEIYPSAFEGKSMGVLYLLFECPYYDDNKVEASITGKEAREILEISYICWIEGKEPMENDYPRRKRPLVVHFTLKKK
jgi:hypothetical protein